MCSVKRGDRTARAVIRDEALRLFAEQGADAVTLRQIAARAGVSPGLVVHHFGSKEGLREAVDEHVLGLFDAVFSAAASAGPADAATTDPAQAGSAVEVMLRHLPPDSPVPAYLTRMLLTGGEGGRTLFTRLYAVSRATLEAMAAAGLAVPGHDPAARAAFLLANDLAVLLLRDHLTAVLGDDPLSAEGMARWAPEVLAVYAGGLTAGGPGPVTGPEKPVTGRENDSTGRKGPASGGPGPVTGREDDVTGRKEPATGGKEDAR